MNQANQEQTVNEYREEYLNMALYSIDPLCDRGLFTPEEIEIVKKYGHWFNAFCI